MNILRQWAAILAVALVFVGQAAAVDHSAYGQLLGRYVTDDGVDYPAWHRQQADRQALTDVLADYGRIRSSALAADERKALLINLYNAAMIQAVLEHYPLDSVTEIGLIPHSVFKQRWIDFDGAKVSLDDIEKGTLLKDYPDARVHFAVNCASVSCPPLRTEPYVGSRLDAQLDEQTRRFAASPFAAQVDDRRQRTAFSKLFKWYKGDFGVEDPAEYLNRYRSTPLPTGYKVDWQPYDWSLNQSSN